MSELRTTNGIKIPYATEGVIRTAQLDDTVAPANSVQLAVNMNFDRVGAIQTRPGVTSYADSLAESISNYGTLNNSVVPDGYDFMFQLGSVNDVLNEEVLYPTAVVVNSTKVAVFWEGSDGFGYCQNISVDESTGTATAIGTKLKFESTANSYNKAVQVSSTQVMNTWRGTDGDGYAQCFNVSGDSITAQGTAVETEPTNYQYPSLAQIDSTHWIVFYTSTGGDGNCFVIEVDLGTGAVSVPGSTHTFDSGVTAYHSCQQIGATHFLNVWTGDGDGKALVFSVNTGTWAISNVGSVFTYDTVADRAKLLSTGDGEHFVSIYRKSSTNVKAQALDVNTGSFAVTNIGTPVTGSAMQNSLAAAALDGSHFAVFWTDGTDGYGQIFETAATTYNMSIVGNKLDGYDFQDASLGMAVIPIDSTKVLMFWGNSDSDAGRMAFFETFGSVVDGSWLYAGHDDEVSNTPSPGGTWTSRRSGLATVSKPRFAQFLNYLWMVNGNDQIGGDAVATSAGGAFGTDLVPAGFPKGDFISAGFEGRVWVANKTLGTIYYSDIVQFIPPVSYTLTYNPDVNFITTLSPQTGQSITALIEVPRSLLVFTQDTIKRIYGATSVDAYAAYNVGTYSQESIVQTKTGIFFHHSSGFYQFDYGSQPVEISRRIIDFIRAIPRASYDDIKGTYDGFDAVEWSVGSVTVEGVVFSNCVLRYTISTQVWTVYDYPGNTVTAMILYDDGTELNHLMGTSAGKTGAMDTGVTDFGSPFYYEFIDRWRAYTDMYYVTKSASGFSVYSENAAGANLSYQKQKSGPNAWMPIGTVTESNNSLMPNSGSVDFDVMRLRLAGNTKGAQVVVHGIEIMSITIKGQEEN